METRYYDDRSSSEALNDVELYRSTSRGGGGVAGSPAQPGPRGIPSQSQLHPPKPSMHSRSSSGETEYNQNGQYGDLSEVATPRPAQNESDGARKEEGRIRRIRAENRARRSNKDAVVENDHQDDVCLSEFSAPKPLSKRHDPDHRGSARDLENGEIADDEDEKEEDVLSAHKIQSREESRHDQISAGATLHGASESHCASSTQSSPHSSKSATQLYIVSHLIFWSFFGCLARLGLQALTIYPGAPESTGTLWANVGGSLIMGFLSEDRRIFRDWGQMKQKQNGPKPDEAAEIAADAKKSHTNVKKTIPLYIGLTTGFCGSFTSFSAFMRDAFLAMSNSLAVPKMSTIAPRNGGSDFMAFLAILILTIALSLTALSFGAHIALFIEPITPALSSRFMRRNLDRLTVFLAWGCWLGAIIMTAIPPHEHWRPRALFALVFAPLGTVARFYASIYLNARAPSFPLGTFTVNVAGTLILAMCYDLQRASPGKALVSCAVLQGVMDGFCGCLTTVSTWVAELQGLRRKHAYIYGGFSVIAGWLVCVVVMGSLKWTLGFESITC